MIRRQPCAFSASLKSEFILNPTNEVLKKLYCNPKNFKSKLQTVSRTSPLSYFFFFTHESTRPQWHKCPIRTCGVMCRVRHSSMLPLGPARSPACLPACLPAALQANAINDRWPGDDHILEPWALLAHTANYITYNTTKSIINLRESGRFYASPHLLFPRGKLLCAWNIYSLMTPILH